MTATMRAVVIDAPGGPDVLHLRELPVPIPGPGQVLIRVEAFGLNRSELHFRRGMGHSGTFPRVPGIEAVGTVEAAPGGEYPAGTQVAGLMGGMGRDFDGGYAEYTVVPASSVVPFRSSLDWSVLGAVPEMLQTAHGSLTVGVGARRGDTILIRGGTSSIGLACIVLAKQQGMTVIATTRNPDRAERLHATGADHVVVDSGRIADTVRRIVPDGVNGAVELIGTGTLPDTLRATAVHGTVSFSGMLSDVWTIPDFYPMAVIPNGVRLTAYSGEASDLPASVLQAFLDTVAAGTVQVPIAKVYALEEIVQAHRDMEDGIRSGKLVVTIR